MVTFYTDPSLPVETRVADLMSRMSIRGKIGQMTMAGSARLAQPADIARLSLGFLLVEAGGAPTVDPRHSGADAAEAMQHIALGAHPPVPLLMASRAAGPTRFPSAVALAAAGDPLVTTDVGRAAAEELASAGIRWTLDPGLELADAAMAGAHSESFREAQGQMSRVAVIIKGMQGISLAQPTSVLATVRLSAGTGIAAEEEPGAPEQALLKAALVYGIQSILVPLNADRHLVTSLLKEQMGFDGMVVSAIEAAAAGTPQFAERLRAAVNAGIDVFVVPADYSLFIETLAGEVRAGRVSTARIDDAVRRILRVKFRMGLFERPFPAEQQRGLAGTVEHRELARRAVRESIVLLKNEGAILPLPRTTRRIIVVGDLADDLDAQSGGPPGGVRPGSIRSGSMPPGGGPGMTILRGIEKAVAPASRVLYDAQGLRAGEGFDVAIAVIGGTLKEPGSPAWHTSRGLSASELAAVARLRAAGLPIVTVIVSGGPLDIAEQLDAWQALAVAWFPGTEGGGVADVLFGLYAPSGKLPFSWPAGVAAPGGAAPPPLFSTGFGLAYR
jgi:beta-glucosidase